MDEGIAVVRTWATHELHPLCTLFPRLPDEELHRLAEDIREHGLQQPIVLHDGMILDGGNRYRACQIARVEPTFVEFGGDSIVQFVLSANLHRRHMSAGQQAAIVSAAQDWAKAHVAGSNQHKPKASGPATLPDLETVADRAAQSGASERTQRMADKVAREAPELAVKVAHGEVSLPQAVRQVEAKNPKPEKPQIVSAPASEKTAAPDVDALKAQIAELTDALAELTPMLDELRADNESMARVIAAEDRVAAALAEAKRYREQARICEARIAGLMSENAEAIRAAKMWKSKFERLEKAHGAARAA